ncbi:hypothetical protein KEM54_003216, partial [Ascosphaera aggregata]
MAIAATHSTHSPEQGANKSFGSLMIYGLFSRVVAAHALVELLGGSDPESLGKYHAQSAAPVLSR